MIGAPTYPMLRDVTQAAVFEAMDQEGIPFLHHKSENRVSIPGLDANILFRSMEEPERLRGTNLAWFAIDELTYCKRDAWIRLQGRLREPKALRRQGIAAWTPKGYDWVYETFMGPNRLNGHAAYLGRPRENIHLPPEFYTNLEHTYDPKFYRQEALGEYLSVNSGQVYYAFDRARNVEQCAFNPSFGPLIWSLDFNVSPMTSVLCQVEIGLGAGVRGSTVHMIVRVLDEIALMSSNVGEACEAFEKKTQEWAFKWGGALNVKVYGDATGNSRTHTTGASCYSIIREFFKTRPHYRVGYNVKNSNPLIRDRVNAVNAKLCAQDGTRSLFIDPKCQALQRDLEQVVWKVDANKKPTGDLDQSGGLTHISDALGYFIDSEFGLTRSGNLGYQPGRIM